MKTFFSSLFIVVIVLNVHSQEWFKTIPKKNDITFYDIQKAFYDYQQTKPFSVIEVQNEVDGEEQQFKRWENFMAPRCYPTGKFNSLALFDEYKLYSKKNKNLSQQKSLANWTPLGPTLIPANGGGMGRINVVTFKPGLSSTMWVGAANGGLWKTTNGGTSWTSNTDMLPSISIADIAIDPVNTNNMYLATGDGYGYEVGTFWGGTYSAGLLKSTDGGATWDTTGLTYSMSDNNIIQRVVVSSVNPQIVIAGARDGLWRSTDGGTTWANLLTAHVYDIEFNTANPSKIYCSTGDDIFVSTNDGATWAPTFSGISSSDRTAIAVTPANSQMVYVLNANGDFYISADGGSSFSYINTADAGYGYYNTILAVSQTDENTIFTSGLDVSKSIDGGLNWTTVSDWAGFPASNYDHADGHDLKFLPGSGNTIFSCNDGGIFKSSNTGNTWTDKSSTIAIAQFYRLGCSATNPNNVLCGQQDNGSVKWNGHFWDQKTGADGMEQLIDFNDTSKIFCITQNGSIHLSTDAGANFIDVSAAVSGDWITPLIIDPNNNQNLYTAYNYVYESNDGGYTWYPISASLTGSNMNVLAIAPSNTNTIYAGDNNHLFRTTDGGAIWTNITSGLPVSTDVLMYVAVANNNPNKIWATFSGFTSGSKVFKSNNGGATWTNVSGSLPNIPVNCIVRVNNSNDALYIGTDFGVFFRDNSMTDWAPFDTGLPHVIVDELEIQYSSAKLRAATYGRGLWETPIPIATEANELTWEDEITIYPNPTKGEFRISHFGFRIEGVKITNVLGEIVYQSQITNRKSEISFDISGEAKGIYFIKITTADKILTKRIIKN